jgi:peptidyl-prolyl cis-trans isomerase C
MAAALAATVSFAGLSAAAFAADTTAAAPATTAAPAIKDGDPIVATVDGTDIKRSQVLNFIAQLPENVRSLDVRQLFPKAEDQIIANHIVAEKASKANLDNDPEVKKMMDEARQQIINSVYVDRQVKDQMTDAKLHEAYNKAVAANKDVEELKVRDIMVDSESKAKDLIAQLNKGADFETLAKADSKGPNAQGGGELGYISKGEVIPEFVDAASAVKTGQYTKTPVHIGAGWHIIQVEDRRKRALPKFDDPQVQTQLKTIVRQQIVADMLTKWEKDASVKKFDINGDPVKDGASK